MAKANVANTLVVPTETTVFPYYDDFSEEKNFYRILFRPGYAVQARELTQLQTILQNQIERFGRHIFTNGSMVLGGEVYFPPNRYNTLNLNPIYANTDINVTLFNKKVITDSSNTVQFRVLDVAGATANDPPVLFGTYISDKAFIDNQTFIIKDEGIYANTAETSSSGYSRFAGIKDSIFFYNGFFIKVPSQTAVIGKYDSNPNCRVGLQLNDEIVTEQSDASLLDPAQESFNYQAPGAARYRADLTLTARSLDSTDDAKFIELARIESGTIKSLVKFPIYSEIEEVLARRTYDESGNYTVKPFILAMKEDESFTDGQIKAVLSPGKGYIFGYEVETMGTTELPIAKGRTLNQVFKYDLNMNYGNYVMVDKLKGLFDTTTMDTFDIHCVPSINVSYANSTVYNTTKIGTGRIRDLEAYSGDTDVNARKYEFYLFDANFINISSNISYSDNASIVRLYNMTSNVTNAYSGAILKLKTGAGSGYSYTINSYDRDTKNIILTTNMLEGVSNSTTASIEFSFENADSFVKYSPLTSGATSNAYADINVMNKKGGISSGAAFINESSLNTLLFPLPDKFIAGGANGIQEMQYSYRRRFNTTFTSGVSSAIQVDTNENMIGASSTDINAKTIWENFLIVCTDKGTSTRSNGEIIRATVSVTGDPEQAVFTTGTGTDNFSATILAKIEFDAGVLAKQKRLQLMNSDVLSSNSLIELKNSPTGSSANVYLPDGQVIITNPSRKVGVPESLYISDVVTVKIFDLNGEAIPAAGDRIAGYSDVTDRYELDSGQRDTHYDHASIKLRPNYASCKGPLIVCCRYYEHGAISAQGGGYFSVDSYPDLSNTVTEMSVVLGDGYSIIPTFKKADGTIVELRDSIDFRPSRQNGSNTKPNYTLNGIKTPLPTTDFGLDYEYYLGRRDLIVLDKNRKFLVIEGIPSKYPQDPSAPTNAMVLYSLGIPPYTEYASNVTVKYVDNKRYTMRDIGKIEKRVENLEYYVALSTLEKNALDINIPDVDGLNRTKYGVFVDSFTSHSLGNPTLKDYKCAMNFKEGWMQNQSETLGVKLKANASLSSGVVVGGEKTVLSYTEKQYLSQVFATKFSPIAEFLYAVFDGNIIMTPESDNWFSTTRAPDIIITDEGINQTTVDNILKSIVNAQSRSAFQ